MKNRSGGEIDRASPSWENEIHLGRLMLDLEALRRILNKALRISANETHLVKLAGDASNRTYHRLSFRDNGAFHSLILMALAEPERFKASEEAMSGVATVTELPFINIQRHLRQCHVAVPEIIYYEPAQGWLLLEDLGDVTMENEVQGKREAMIRAYYQAAIDGLITLQRLATPIPAVPTIAHERAFDQSLLLWEFDHFIEYGIKKRNGKIISEKDKNAIRAYFSDIALRLASLPQVFTHRDYHSRNLMVQPDTAGFRIRVIDFQDALMGPRQYDLASLLRDSYVDLPETLIDELIVYYLGRWEEQTGEGAHAEMFREYFDLVSIQRNLKAAGRFFYIDLVKKNSRFLAYVPPTLAKVKRNLLKYKRLSPLHQLLATYVEELR